MINQKIYIVVNNFFNASYNFDIKEYLLHTYCNIQPQCSLQIHLLEYLFNQPKSHLLRL